MTASARDYLLLRYSHLNRVSAMSATQQNQNAIEDPFSLTVDQYGRLWLHAKAQGVPIMLDLAEKGVAFEIMASTMAENGYNTNLH